MRNNIDTIADFYEKRIVAVIFLVALALRLITVINLPNRYQVPGADAAQYDNIAVSLLSGRGYSMDLAAGRPTSFWVPLYPIFLAFIYSIFGIRNYLTVRIIQSIMAALLCVVIFYIARCAFNRKVGLLAAWMLVFYQPYIFYSFYGGPGFLLSENLFIFLLAIAVLFLMRNLFVHFNLKNSILAGILIGAVLLTKPVFALFPAVLFLLLMYKNKYPFMLAFKKMLPLFISIALVILPWTIRNCLVNKAFVPLSIESGFVLFSGNNSYVSGGGHVNPQSFLPQEQRSRLEIMSELQQDRMLARLAKEFLVKNYKKIPKLFVRKLLVMWDVFDTDYSVISCKRKYNLWYSIILMFGIVGIAASLKSKFNINSLLLIALFIYFSVISMIFTGEPRFRYPLEAYLIIFSSLGVFAIYDRYKRKYLAFVTISAVIGVNFLFYIYSDLLLHWVRRFLWKV